MEVASTWFPHQTDTKAFMKSLIRQGIIERKSMQRRHKQATELVTTIPEVFTRIVAQDDERDMGRP